MKMTKDLWEQVKYFKPEEFMCPCCNRVDMDAIFVFMLDSLRKLVGAPLHITSGYRCEKHNKEVGGSPNSAHLRGKAADILVTDSEMRWRILKFAFLLGFPRIGIGQTFIHLDIDDSLPSPRVWLY